MKKYALVPYSEYKKGNNNTERGRDASVVKKRTPEREIEDPAPAVEPEKRERDVPREPDRAPREKAETPPTAVEERLTGEDRGLGPFKNSENKKSTPAETREAPPKPKRAKAAKTPRTPVNETDGSTAKKVQPRLATRASARIQSHGGGKVGKSWMRS